MARPRKAEEARRRHVAKVRLSDAELAQLQHAADAAGVPLSTFLRLSGLGISVRAKPSRTTNEVIRQLAAVGNNLNQLAREANIGRFPGEGRLRHALGEVQEAIKRVR